MADPEEIEEDLPKKGSKLPLIIGLVLALASGGGGFYAVQSGMLFGDDSHGSKHNDAHSKDGHGSDDHAPEKVAHMGDVAFVPVDPLVISLGEPHGHLRFRAQLEVHSDHTSEVTNLMPRVVDVLNNYLRALAVEDLADGSSLTRLRAQMLRRVQVVTGSGRVEDLLIMEFVLN